MVDVSTLKMKVGRPQEDNLERVDLKPYLVQASFRRRFKKFYDFWDQTATRKAVNVGKLKYLVNAEIFFGEVIDKFLGLPEGTQREVGGSAYPIRMLYELTNLSKPNLFDKKQDNKDFYEILLNTEL